MPDLLIKPFQRITRYPLLLREIVKCTKRAGEIEAAKELEVAAERLQVILNDSNNIMQVSRLQGFEVSKGHQPIYLPLDICWAWWSKLVNLLLVGWNCELFEVQGSTLGQVKHSSILRINFLE